MFLELAHTKLEAYKYARELVFECYRVTKNFPQDERFALVQQIRRAAISVHLNLAEGSSRKSQKERNRFFEIARGSVIEIDAAMSIVVQLQYVQMEEIKPLGGCIVKVFKLLSGMIKKDETRPSSLTPRH